MIYIYFDIYQKKTYYQNKPKYEGSTSQDTYEKFRLRYQDWSYSEYEIKHRSYESGLQKSD